MTREFEDLLRRELEAVVPDPPEDPGRASGARRIAHRKRSTRTGLFTVCVVTAAVAALVVVPVVLSRDEVGNSGVTLPEDDDGGERPSDDIEPGYEYICPESTPTLMAPSRELPGGAVRARICDAGEMPWSAPEDALTTGLDQLIVTINSADPLPPDMGCTDDLGPAFTMAFQYENGATYAIRGSFGGCDTIVVGHDERLGAIELVDLYADLLARQRAETEPPPDNAGVRPSCADAPGSVRDDWRTILYPDRDLDLTAGVLCVFPEGGAPTEVPLTAEMIEQVNDEVASGAVRDPGGVCRCLGPTVVIRGVDAWGDRYQLVREEGRSAFSIGTWSWQPSAESERLLASLME